MQIVIDIDEEIYERCRKFSLHCGEAVSLEGTVANGTPLNEVLDKIKAEIDDLNIHYDNDYFSGNKDAMFKCDEVMQIIDKYRGDRHET